MKLREAIHLLLVLFVLGTFANFAQNEYGADLQNMVCAFLAIYYLSLLFSTEKRYRESFRSVRVYHRLENSCLFLVFLGLFMKFFHLPGAGVAIILGTFFFLVCNLLYLTPLFKAPVPLHKYRLFRFSVVLMLIAWVFYLQHWPGGQIAAFSGVILALVCLTIMILQARKRQLPFLLFGSQGYFHQGFQVVIPYVAFVCIVSLLYNFGLAPKRYSNQQPTKMMERIETMETARFTNSGLPEDTLVVTALDDYMRLMDKYENAFE